MNIGNTCFLNSALQCLLRVTPLTRYILSAAARVNPRNPLGTGGAVFQAFQALIHATQGSSRAVSPGAIKQAVARRNPTFRDFGQHDSAEFLISLLDGLHEDLNQSRVANGERINVEALSGMALHTVCNDSEIVRLFHGETKTLFKFRCRHTEAVHEPLAQWALPVPAGGRPLRLEDCIEAWRRPQRMAGDNTLGCDQCDRLVECDRLITVVRFAPIIVVQLKRFEQIGSRLEKSHTIISYPVEFDTSPYCEERSGVYLLTGVSKHGGSLSGGHYTALVRDPDDLAHWYSISDSSVSSTQEPAGGRIADGSAMFLVYQRHG
jgi:ubiquitin carboxyl-terminal hydrolase 8